PKRHAIHFRSGAASPWLYGRPPAEIRLSDALVPRHEDNLPRPGRGSPNRPRLQTAGAKVARISCLWLVEGNLVPSRHSGETPTATARTWRARPDARRRPGRTE